MPLFSSVFTSNIQIIATTCETSCLALFSPVFRLSGVFPLIRALSSVRFAYLRACRPLLFSVRPSVRFFVVLRLFALFLSFFVKIFFTLWQVSVAVFKKTLQKSAKFFVKSIAHSKKRRTFAIRKFIDNVENLETRLSRGCNMVLRNITLAVFPYAVDVLKVPQQEVATFQM